MTRRYLDRRTVLRGSGGAVLGVPILHAMLNGNGTAYAQGQALPKRFGLWFYGNGVVPEKWYPTATGAGWQLSEELAPLAKVKDHLNVVSGYDIKQDRGNPHNDNMAAIMTMRPALREGSQWKPAGPSLDQIAADALGGGPSLQVGVCREVDPGNEGPLLRYASYRGPNQPLAPEYSPAALYARLFGAKAPGTAPAQPSAAAARAELRASILDAVREDAKRLMGRVGQADRARLDAHFTGVSELRTRLLQDTAKPPSAGAPGACSSPAAVTETNDRAAGAKVFESTHRAFADIIALAWSCDLSRVFNLFYNGPFAEVVFSNLGHNKGEHALTHSTQQDLVNQAVVFIMKNFAYMMERFRDTPDGAGNLLDNSVTLCMTECSWGYDHSQKNMPLVLAGRGRGSLVHPGIHHRVVGGNVSDVLLTAIRAAGADVASIGTGPLASRQVASALLR